MAGGEGQLLIGPKMTYIKARADWAASPEPPLPGKAKLL
jgi:hypothetical protein